MSLTIKVETQKSTQLEASSVIYPSFIWISSVPREIHSGGGQSANVLSCLKRTCLQVGKATFCCHQACRLVCDKPSSHMYQLQPGLPRSLPYTTTVLLLQSGAPFLLLPFIYCHCIVMLPAIKFEHMTSILPIAPKLLSCLLQWDRLSNPRDRCYFHAQFTDQIIEAHPGYKLMAKK